MRFAFCVMRFAPARNEAGPDERRDYASAVDSHETTDRPQPRPFNSGVKGVYFA